MWHVFERSWFRSWLSTSINWLSANPSDLYSRIIQYESRLQPRVSWDIFTLPSILLRDFGIVSWHKPRPIYLHHLNISFESTQYELGYYWHLSIINKWIVIRHAPWDLCIPGKTTEHTVGTGRQLSPQSLSSGSSWYGQTCWFAQANSGHGRKPHVAFGNRRGRMIGFMFWLIKPPGRRHQYPHDTMRLGDPVLDRMWLQIQFLPDPWLVY